MYRTWEGCDTTKEPKMQSSVSMFHPTWDDEMESIEDMTTKERRWDKELECFFEAPGQMGGFPRFLDEVLLIQGMLNEAVRNSVRPQKVLNGTKDKDLKVALNPPEAEEDLIGLD